MDCFVASLLAMTVLISKEAAMRYLMMAVIAGSMVPFTSHARAADEMTIAVFTKNSTNPAYEAFHRRRPDCALNGGASPALRSEAARQCRRTEGDGGAGPEGPAGRRDLHSRR